MKARGSDKGWDAADVLIRAATWLFAAILLAGCGGGSGTGMPNPPSQHTASLSYPSSALVLVTGTAMNPAVPTASPGLSSFTVTPALPAGLSINASNGTISGTPTVASAVTAYSVKASGGGASIAASLSITVNAAPPSAASYGAAGFTFTTGVAASPLVTAPTTKGGAASRWSITPSLPGGLTFDTTTGRIGGTPTAPSAAASYIVTALNASGQTTVTVRIEVDSGPLLDLGHTDSISVLRVSGSSVLSVDQSGHWNLWDYASASKIASGDLYCAAENCSPPMPHLADMAGGTVVLATQDGFEFLSATTGQVISNVTASVSWWSLASDGSYLAAGGSTGLFAWSPSGDPQVSLSGDYSKANVFAAPGQIRVAAGPAGANVIQTVAVPGGASTTGPAFTGQFSSWFLDGNRFISTAGTTALVYSQSSTQEAAIALPADGTAPMGQSNWVWTVSGTSTLEVFAIATGSTPAATFNVGLVNFEIPSGTTIAVSDRADGLSVIDLSGTTPTSTAYTLPSGLDAYATSSTSQWMIGNSNGVLLDGASLSGSPRYFDYGKALSIAGSNGSIAISTASGRLVYFDAGTLNQEGVIPFSASQMLLSSDGTVLAALGGQNTDPSGLHIYSLPSGGLLQSWVGGQEISLSGSGAVLGESSGCLGGAACSYTLQAVPTLGGSPIFSTTFSATQDTTPTILVSPNGTLLATSTGLPTSGTDPNPGTNFLLNGSLTTAVEGMPIGWIDDGHLLVNTFTLEGLGQSDGYAVYAGCSVYSPSGQVTGPCVLPNEITSFQPVTSDSIYVVGFGEFVNQPEIRSVSTGNISWMTGDTASDSLGAVAGNRVVFVSGAQVLAQGY